MTTYGTIPTSSPSKLEYISRAKERLKSGLGARRPWKEMYNSIGFPASFGDAIRRIRKNLAYFRTNYAIVVLLIVFLSLLWHPISLIVFVVMMAVWLFLYFLRDEPLVIFGRTVDDRVILVVLSVLTIVFLLLTNATTNILVSLAIGVCIVLIHAALRKTDDLPVDEESGATAALYPGGASPSS
ncbi:PRA1 family protein F2-like [Diospyros lotus]|uniref:PRA1 family protein F2-like n=1 Tax=Diospyros lotus TaxID=55363 RepID=UPI002258559D|nr:PRA1 family protein F2-like [Diospyros lotus]